MEIINAFERVSKDRFRGAANRLLTECFVLKKHKDSAADYNYILNNKDAFFEFFDLLGYELVVDELGGVIGLNNPAGTGRIHLKKIESMLLLILRLLYIEKRKTLSQAEDVVIFTDEIYDKYNMLQVKKKLDGVTLRNAFSVFQRYRLVNKLDTDVAKPESRILLYPSLFLGITMASLDEMYTVAKEKLDKYTVGGNFDESYEFTDSEEIDES